MTGPQDPQDPNQPEYGQPAPPPPPPGYGYGSSPAGYGPPPPGYQPVPAAGAPVRVRRPWPPRINQRPEPKYGVSLAGIGVAIAIGGVVLWGGDYLGTSGGGGGLGSGGVSDSHRLLGIALSLVAIALGYTLALRYRTGPLTTAGVVASAVGVPVLMGFLTFDPSSSGGPFQIDAIALVSIGAWVVSYFWVRGTRGHSFYLGLAAIVLWIYILDKAESSVFSLGGLLGRAFGESFGGPDWNTVGGLSLTFGIGYYVAMAVLDQSGRRGAGTPFAVSGFVATVAGILAFSVHAHTKGTAAIFVGFGLALAWVGARSARRFTTWTWAYLMGGGVVTLIGDSLSDNTAAAGIVLILIGAALVGVAALYAIRTGEPADDPVDAS